jgi:hypothetical protein
LAVVLSKDNAIKRVQCYGSFNWLLSVQSEGLRSRGR